MGASNALPRAKPRPLAGEPSRRSGPLKVLQPHPPTPSFPSARSAGRAAVSLKRRGLRPGWGEEQGVADIALPQAGDFLLPDFFADCFLPSLIFCAA